MPRRRPAAVAFAALVVSAAGISASALPAASAGTAAVTFRAVGLGATLNYGEPSLAVYGSHTVVSTPGGDGVNYWYSGDGRTFGKTTTSSLNGGGDSELHFLPNGTLLSADLEITDSNVKVSKDFGRTWDGGRSVGIEQDRQWFASSPDGKTAYLVYHDFAAEAEFFARSTDGGLSWPTADGANLVNSANQIAAPGAASTPHRGSPASIADQGGNTFSGPMLVGPNGSDLYVVYSISDLVSNILTATPPYGPTRGIVVAHSGDAGKTWTNNYAVVGPTQNLSGTKATNGAIFPWGTVDQAGNVYIVFNSDRLSLGHFHTYYVWSSNKGRTWSSPVKVDSQSASQGATVYATAAAGAPGVLDVAWYSTRNGTSTDDANADWYVDFAQVRHATTAATRAIRGSRLSPTSMHHGQICLQGLLCLTSRGDRSLADFFELAIGSDGMAQVAYADNASLGLDANGKRIGQVVWAKQTSGPSALR